MSTHEQQMTPQQSLDLINDMIARAKKSFQKMSFYFLLWGVLLILAGVSQFVLSEVFNYKHAYIGWPILGTLGGIIAGIHGAREGKKAGASTFTDRVMAFLWGSFTVSLVLVIIGAVISKADPGPYIMIMTGVPTFVSGGIMNFKPLVVGGILFWLIGLASFFAPMEYRPLIFSFAILCGYIIPGLMLKRAENARV